MKEVSIIYNGFWLCHTKTLLTHMNIIMMNIIMKHTPIYKRHKTFAVCFFTSYTLEQINFVCLITQLLCHVSIIVNKYL